MIGLKIEEIKTMKQEKYHRICDENETLSFVKLLEIYNPKALNPEDITTETTTTPQTTKPTETTKIQIQQNLVSDTTKEVDRKAGG